MATESTISVNAEIEHPEKSGGDLLSPDVGMLLFTYLTFFILLGILYKVAWKPILESLSGREEFIRRSLDDAKKAREELEQIQETNRKIIAEADLKSKEILDQARKAAVEAARVIENKAKEQSTIMLNNATKEIETSLERARATLRRESADLAVGLAQKIIGQTLDEFKDQKLTDQLIKDFYADK